MQVLSWVASSETEGTTVDVCQHDQVFSTNAWLDIPYQPHFGSLGTENLRKLTKGTHVSVLRLSLLKRREWNPTPATVC